MEKNRDQDGTRTFNDRNFKTSHMRRVCLGSIVTGVALLLSGCFQSRFFDIEWDEEIRLSNGNIVVAHVKRTYERLARQGFRSKYEGSIPRSFTLTFDGGPSVGNVTQTFDRMQPAMLDTDGKTWYLAMRGSGGTAESLRKWPFQPPNLHSLGVLKDGKFSSITIDQLPVQFNSCNMLIEYDSADLGSHSTEELSRFDGQVLTLDVKERYLKTRFRSDGRMYRIRNQQS